MTTYIIIALVAAALGALIAWFSQRAAVVAADSAQSAVIAGLKAESDAKQARIAEWERSAAEWGAKQTALQAVVTQREKELSGQESAFKAAIEQAEKQQVFLQSATEEMSTRFRALAAELLEEKGTKFVALHETALAQLLTPLKVDLDGFRKRVDEVYVADSSDRGALKEMVRALGEKSDILSDQANDLTKALKGDSKVQGDWGEMILDRLLDAAGFIEGTHYVRQGSHIAEEGNRVIPDVVLHLPEAHDVVIDSKVTLTAYSDYVVAQDDKERDRLRKAHVDSVRAHIKGLSEKAYQELYTLNALDYVVMFLPVEGAFLEALTADPELFRFGWDKHVLLVSPSTLLYVLRMISYLWQQDGQSKHAVEIAERGEALYAKFESFIGDLEKVEDQLDKAHDGFKAAKAKLHTGRGNLVRQAEMLIELGVRAKKRLDPKLVDMATAEDDAAGGMLTAGDDAADVTA